VRLGIVGHALLLVTNDDQRIPGTKEIAMRERGSSLEGGGGGQERTGKPKRGDSCLGRVHYPGDTSWVKRESRIHSLIDRGRVHRGKLCKLH
jgi:hypothetical protein